jgi:hypothetical protein
MVRLFMSQLQVHLSCRLLAGSGSGRYLLNPSQELAEMLTIMKQCPVHRIELPQDKVKVTLSHFVSISKSRVHSVSFEPALRN